MTELEESRVLDVERIAAGGDGIAHADGMVVFIPRTAPGDHVRARVDQRRRFARGRLEHLITPSADRVQPICLHYTRDDCGGCQLQHLTYEAQLRAKAVVVADAIHRIGRRADVSVSVQPSPTQWRYRQKLTLAMRRQSGNGNWVVGLHSYHDPVSVFQLKDCPITSEPVVAAWREVMAAHDAFPRADELRASIQVSGTDCVMVVEGGSSWPQRAEFFRAVPTLTALWWKRPHERRQLIATRADSDASATASFVQVNPGVAEALRAYVLERVTAVGPRKVIDAYAGSGAMSVELARRGMEVTAIEVDRDASAYCAKRMTPPSTALAGRVEDLLPKALPAEFVLLNPPRSGLDLRVAEILQGGHPAPTAVVYVSCDPATLARDLARMPRYAIASLRSFDMFPQTAHVETVCELRWAA